jgi:hypothetical protein
MANLLFPKSIDSGAEVNHGPALVINFILILAFGLQHVVMARNAFKEWWVQFVPRPIEPKHLCDHLKNNIFHPFLAMAINHQGGLGRERLGFINGPMAIIRFGLGTYSNFKFLD